MSAVNVGASVHPPVLNRTDPPIGFLWSSLKYQTSRYSWGDRILHWWLLGDWEKPSWRASHHLLENRRPRICLKRDEWCCQVPQLSTFWFSSQRDETILFPAREVRDFTEERSLHVGSLVPPLTDAPINRVASKLGASVLTPPELSPPYCLFVHGTPRSARWNMQINLLKTVLPFIPKLISNNGLIEEIAYIQEVSHFIGCRRIPLKWVSMTTCSTRLASRPPIWTACKPVPGHGTSLFLAEVKYTPLKCLTTRLVPHPFPLSFRFGQVCGTSVFVSWNSQGSSLGGLRPPLQSRLCCFWGLCVCCGPNLRRPRCHHASWPLAGNNCY